jgi:hypothetical protein
MRLAELHPKWIHPHMFIFVCPCCRDMLLSCKTAFMSHTEQYDLFQSLGGWRADHIVGCKESCAWTVTGTLPEITVTPSVDASAAGHWHGYITAGEIR